MDCVQNASAEASMEWVLSHMEDPGFNDPLEAPAAAPEASTAAPAAEHSADPEALGMLQAMGFLEQQAGHARLLCKLVQLHMLQMRACRTSCWHVCLLRHSGMPCHALS